MGKLETHCVHCCGGWVVLVLCTTKEIWNKQKGVAAVEAGSPQPKRTENWNWKIPILEMTYTKQSKNVRCFNKKKEHIYDFICKASKCMLCMCCGRESRYLLLLTENYGGLHILTDNLLAEQAVVPIFGSSFPKDQEYTQVVPLLPWLDLEIVPML